MSQVSRVEEVQGRSKEGKESKADLGCGMSRSGESRDDRISDTIHYLHLRGMRVQHCSKMIIEIADLLKRTS